MSKFQNGDLVKVKIVGPTLDDSIDDCVEVNYSYYIKGKCVLNTDVCTLNTYFEDNELSNFKFDIIRDLMEEENICEMTFKDFIYEQEEGTGNAKIELQTTQDGVLSIEKWSELIKNPEIFDEDTINIIKTTGYSEYSSTVCAIELKKSALFIANRIVKVNEKIAKNIGFKLTEENISHLLFTKVENDYYFKNNLLNAVGIC